MDPASPPAWAKSALSPARARWFLLLAVPVLFLRLGELALVEPSEGRYAEIGREMLESGDWVTPHLNYQRHLEKPPFAYWMTALGIGAFGADNFGARCMAAAFGVLLLWLAFEIGTFLYDALAGLLTALFLLAHILFFVVARSATADIFVTVWGAAAVYSFLRWHADPADPPLWRRAFWVCLGAGLLAKGPVAYVHGLLPALVFLALRGDWPALRRLRPARGLLLSAAFIVPWMVLLEQHTPGAVRYLLLRKATDAMTSSEGYHHEPLWYYLPGLVLGCLPWSFFLPAFWCEHVRAAAKPRDRWAGVFLFAWWPSLLVVFTLAAAKLMTYILPITVPIAVMNGRLWSDLLRRPDARLNRPVLLGACAWFVFVAAVTIASPLLWLVPPDQVLAAGGRHVPWIVAAGGLYAAAVRLARAPHRRGWIPLLTACYLLVVLQIGIGARKDTEIRYSSIEPIGGYLQAHAGPDEKVVCYRCFIRSLPFYVRRRVVVVDYDKEDDRFDRKAPGFAEHVLSGQDRLMALVRGADRVWVVTKVKYRDANPELAAATREVDRNGSVVLLVNR